MPSKETPAILAGVFALYHYQFFNFYGNRNFAAATLFNYYMTERKILYALNRIKSCKEHGFALEALIKNYHLNLDIIKHILSSSIEDYSAKDKKIKMIVNELMEEISVNNKLKAILNKKNLKTVKPWLLKMEDFFRALKMTYPTPTNLKALQSETEKIFGILNISVNKLFIKNKD